MNKSSQLPPAVFLMGPTASGKTDLAVQLIQHLPFEIISVDSALVYRGMDIGTAKPDQALLEKAPHRLIDICEPSEAYSAARFRQDALSEMQDITASGKIPLLVGGTMLYFRALEHGLSELPEADPVVRKRLELEAQQKGWGAMYQRLQQLDPASASRIHPNDPQRIQRALEVYEITGNTMSSLYAQKTAQSIPYNVVKIAISPEDRSVLHERIGRRFHQMLAQGLVDEVRTFYARDDMQLDLPSMRSVGYRQVWEYLAGEYSEERMAERAIVATRQFAKRQLTWLRSDKAIIWFEARDNNLLRKVLKYLDTVPISK